MALVLKQIVTALSCEFIEVDSSILIDTVSVDSRSHQNADSTLFFALIGPHHDAHQYIETLIEQGVKSFVVQTINEKWLGKANFLKVANTLEALQLLATYYRNLFSFPVIGITGSNGKTIVKEWLNFLLSPDYTIIRSPKSYNSQVGVPLSVIGINEMHNLGIFEAGISTVNEMQNLQKIIQPTIGILTNIGSAHDQGFIDIYEKIKEKLKLFKEVEILILNKNKTIEAFLDPSIKTFTWSIENKEADVFFEKKEIEQHTDLKVIYKEHCFEITLPFIDEASLENSMHCVLTMLYLGYNDGVIKERIAQLYPVEMRLKVKTGIYNSTLIDDSYSSDFQSLKIALDFLQNQNQNPKKTLIISDIFQSGLTNEELYSRIAQLIIFNKITKVICIGNTITKYKNKFQNAISFESTASFVNAFDTLDFSDETILIKGARVFEFEKIVSLLEEKKHETVLEINLNSLSHNFNYYKTKIKPTTKIMGMVKAFGYGSGSFEIAKLLAHHKVDYLGVAFADEGIELKKAGIEVPIMVMNPEMTSFRSIIQYGLEPEIYSLRGLKAFLKILEEKKQNHYPIHIKINTGMNRLGFDEEIIPELISILKQNKRIQVNTILSHFAESDNDADRTFSLNQINLFDRLSKQIIEVLEYNPIRHICNSSGISNYPEGEFDMVRLGVGMYGVSNDLNEMKYLETVGTLKSVISQIRTLKIGDTVGYNRRFVVEKPTRMAVIPIGYADGISRKWGRGVGYLLVNGEKAPILGSICMDMLMIDVTNISCAEGNEVVVFGKDLPVTVIANAIDTIPYEILTGISRRVSRIFYRE
ncbi:bifunctional UDP-N-acetylmuramoyl-tripeptide:D-alanyl-D-alanine ligase/alanine racemase [Flavobacterium columnare]|uniref:bifunctional UDP-N-acetylmuramoyl-tripeptide:D-alanyl-D-alanine ligase/alanine racemase n=1 Tax=Flavobacterium columnare TaxID=996 RepID=UPI0017875301|nr:bifunctional UDP-N-acetylmuramoyl-tripeptide:D-alanyl-D-alanine ligase/alanine racemase [Flavobacterium columnare]QOG90920.1 bifunctional UDP-N-acetylmuramoyl-tripeptide:D-alanyl-D-alanine ligase/alanine racemase [Flavobacterium columnare]QOG93574.1 bifunctional UDP-N-acetylmuramoyl-tripeptide:D-alanyl-D-alanine ligase/alanine racemase [Flavobacterium columnare]QOG96241.1 bifunctional UDP-N-acetylmuramoyl-tripeptide:D-alanyl-D-alanine ligase/alanine racemase [Flavobacterium columnare]QOG9890